MNIYIFSIIASFLIVIIYIIYNKKQNENYINKKDINKYIMIVSISFSCIYFYMNNMDMDTEIINTLEKTINNPKVPF
jgi:hypothetical protein